MLRQGDARVKSTSFARDPHIVCRLRVDCGEHHSVAITGVKRGFKFGFAVANWRRVRSLRESRGC